MKSVTKNVYIIINIIESSENVKLCQAVISTIYKRHETQKVTHTF